MKLKFSIQGFQTDAVDSVVNIFKGQRVNKANFTVSTGSLFSQGTGNYLDILDDQILENVRSVQFENKLSRIKSLEGMNFSVEMETGTGKTYVYIKTILELNKKYGFSKFIVVVPSIAIKEGVYKSFDITKEHFSSLYDNVPYNYFIYDSKKRNQVENFATNTDIEIMIVTIGAFISDFGDSSKKSNLMYRPDEKMNWQKPIDLIKNTNPVVIIDEPQSVDNTPKSKEAISKLNPLCQLRYSATHKNKYNLVYKLDAVDAYNQKLVKQISVNSISTEESVNTPYIKLISVSDKNGYNAKFELNSKNKSGAVSKQNFVLKIENNLKDFTKLDYYENYVLDDIDTTPGSEYIQFTNNQILHIGEVVGSIDDIAIKRAQIRTTIDAHLKKERQYTKEGIKVLSLFFIDEVSKYRNYDVAGNETPGDYYKIFEEEYSDLINGKFKDLRELNPQYYEVVKVHDGYFSVDGKGRIKNTNGDSIADESTYSKIMKNKEKLLSFNEPLRFIFSHSALKEGWDNPNVFQVCTLVENNDNFTKRQKVGRGLRICVNQNGERVNDDTFNELTVIANESYKKFAEDLQKEIEQEAGFTFGVVDRMLFANITTRNPETNEYVEIGIEKSESIYNLLIDNEIISTSGKITEKGKSDIRYRNIEMPDILAVIKDDIYYKLDQINTKLPIRNSNNEITVKLNKQVYLSDDFKKLWAKIKQKTKYSVNMNVDDFINSCIANINEMSEIKKIKIRSESAKLDINETGIESTNIMIRTVSDVKMKINYPDPMRYIQDQTNIKRKTAYKIIAESNKISSFLNNPQKYLEEVCKIIQKNKKSQLVNGIKYEKINDYYEQSLFENDELKAYLESNALESNKSVMDHIIYDSEIESDFAKNMEDDDDCKLFVKLPSWFIIDTPLGAHNPDWAVIMNEDSKEVLYFIVETKGSRYQEDRRGNENDKIVCANKHFDALESGIKYQVSAGYYKDFKI
ncbi:MAG: DEAD/DEAH box helicase family protein [Tissierellia bacterium]|nr:DEAD/DEAH box helicase family protein [Tissierellia bacterium]